MLQINHAMSSAIQDFIREFDPNDVEDEIMALCDALKDPTRSVHAPSIGPAFIVDRSFKGVVVLRLNQDMTELLLEFLNEVVGHIEKPIYALRFALQDPSGGKSARENRPQRQRIRQSSYDRPEYQNSEDHEDHQTVPYDENTPAPYDENTPAPEEEEEFAETV